MFLAAIVDTTYVTISISMSWKEFAESLDEPQRPYTAKDIMQSFILQEQPIEGKTLFHILEPLAGTSFMQTAIEELRLYIDKRRFATDKGVYPSDLNLFFWGSRYPDRVRQVESPQRIDEATLAIQSLSTHAIGIDKVSALNWMKDPSEMLLMQGRWDVVYHDREKTQRAFSHLAAQWQFYAKGRYLHTIPESKIQFEDDADTFQERTILPEGYHETTFFIDGRRRPFLALPAQQQDFVRSFRMLYISPHFSFDAARRK